jgi:hypothetical protein
MNEGTFNRNANDLLLDHGVLRTVPIFISNEMTEAAAWQLAASGFFASLTASTQETFIPFMVPRDYNAGDYDSEETYPADQLILSVLAIGGTVDTNTLDIDSITRARAGDTSIVATSVDISGLSSSNTSQAVPTAAMARYDFNLVGLGFQPDDFLTITLGCTIGSGSIGLTGCALSYRSVYRPYNDADR